MIYIIFYKWAFRMRLKHPETCTVVAVGYYYTLNSGQDGAGNTVEVFSGYATQG